MKYPAFFCGVFEHVNACRRCVFTCSRQTTKSSRDLGGGFMDQETLKEKLRILEEWAYTDTPGFIRLLLLITVSLTPDQLGQPLVMKTLHRISEKGSMGSLEWGVAEYLIEEFEDVPLPTWEEVVAESEDTYR